MRGDRSRRGEEAATEGRGKLPAEAPWTREAQAGAGSFARSKRGCRGGSRGQEWGGEGAGQRLRPGEKGGGGLEGGCPTANTHTGQPGTRGVEMLGGPQTSGKGWRGRATHPCTSSLVQAGKRGGTRVEGLEGRFTGAAGLRDLGQLGTVVQQKEGFQPDTRKDFLD